MAHNFTLVTQLLQPNPYWFSWKINLIDCFPREYVQNTCKWGVKNEICFGTEVVYCSMRKRKYRKHVVLKHLHIEISFLTCNRHPLTIHFICEEQFLQVSLQRDDVKYFRTHLPWDVSILSKHVLVQCFIFISHFPFALDKEIGNELGNMAVRFCL